MQPRNAMPQLPVEIWQRIVDYHTPSREDYAVKLPWKRSARDSTLVSLTQVCSAMRQMALPLVWAIVYVETMKDWGLLWKRISCESGQHIHTFINFWAIARLPPLCMDHLQDRGKDLLWYAFIDRKNNPLSDVVTGQEKFIIYDPYDRLGNGPDGHGPDAIIHSREMFLQACKEISGTWTKRLQTIYWDATTTFPEEVILNIRDIQETNDADDKTSDLPGLEHLCIDYIERTAEEAEKQYRRHIGDTSALEHARRMAYFNEPIWKLGSKTLSALKFFSLAPPFWANVSTPVENMAKKSPHRMFWAKDPVQFWEHTGSLEKQLKGYDEFTGPGRYYKLLQSIQPEIFFTSSQAPFHCKELLPCWARLRCLYVFRLVVMTNDEATSKLDLPKLAVFFQTQKFPDARIWVENCRDRKKAGQYLRGAIQLRPALEQLSEKLGRRLLTGEDIRAFASAGGGSQKKEALLRWTEHWKYGYTPDVVDRDVMECQLESEVAEDLFPIYKEWLQDPCLAEEVAQSYNKGVEQHNTVAYPFCHSEEPGKVYLETSLCETRQDGKVWLDRPKHRGCYSNINIEAFPKLCSETPMDRRTLHPRLKQLPAYLPSL